LTNIPQNTAKSTPAVGPDKTAAKQCLLSADRFLKESRFQDARTEIEKAKKFDPSNVYVLAFLDRINYFEAQQKKEAQVSAAKAHPSPAPAAPSPQPHAATPPPHAAIPQPVKPIVPNVPKPAPATTEVPLASAPPPPVKPKEAPEPVAPARSEHRGVETTLEEMKRQIEMLTHSLEQEKKAREDMSKQQLQSTVLQLRTSMEKAWATGAPNEQEEEALHKLAISLSIPENVELSLRREVKLKMYSTAVKEVISKRQLLRSSSSTLEWLRKVYQVSMEEYLEYETKFLLDLVADQYKGTLLYVTPNVKTKDELIPRLKAAGYAVVLSGTPEEALEKIEKINPNIILCHTEFSPGSLSGVKFLHLLRASAKFNFIPFLLLCESPEVSQLKSSELRQHEGFLKKPVDVDELMIAMNEKLARFRDYVSSLS
jgi:CheY-like chemotaxis protein